MKWVTATVAAARCRGLRAASTSRLCSRAAAHPTAEPTKMTPPWHVMFFGTNEFSVKSLEILHQEQVHGNLIGRLDVVTLPMKRVVPAVRRYCTQEQLPLWFWPVTVPPHTYDIGIVVSFGKLIPPEVINAFPMGILNVHGSLLPRWRGAAPVIHAVLNNDQQTGVTLMRIKPFRFDVGEMISKATVSVPWDIKSGELTRQLAQVGAEQLQSALHNLPNNLLSAQPQPSSGVTKAPKVGENTSKINWENWSCTDIQAHYRALDDYFPLWAQWQGDTVQLRDMVMQHRWSGPGAKTAPHTEGTVQELQQTSATQAHGKSMKNDDIEDGQMTSVVSDGGGGGGCGSVVYDRKGKVLRVKCWDGWVSFKSVVVKKKHKVMSAQDFYNGFISKVLKKHHRFT